MTDKIPLQQQPPSQPKRRKDPLSGWLCLYKPVGLGSMQATSQARGLLGAAKAGHTGTLDPLAEGVLPIAFGEATKLIPLVHEGQKTYCFTVSWGTQTTTDDLEGEVMATHAHRPSADQIVALFPRFIGTIDQVPPAFSAVKINGQRAYAMARAGNEVVITPRPVTIYDLRLIRHDETDSVFEVTCGTGTYVRALARDMALAAGTVGHCTRIIRTKVGVFDAAMTISLDSLREMPYESRGARLLPLRQGLDDIPALHLTDDEAQRVRTGQRIRFLTKQDEDRLAGLHHQTFLAVTANAVIAVCQLDGVTLQIARVINT